MFERGSICRLMSHLAGILISVSLAWAQASFTGSILGTLTDPSGGAIAGANVSIGNVRTNETSMTKSDASGNYIVPNLRPGEYVLTI